MYIVEFEAEDGYVYKLYITVGDKYMNIFGVYNFDIYAFTRVETFTSGEYTVTIERILATDLNEVNLGGFMMPKLKKGAEELEYDLAYIRDNTIYYVVRERDEKDEVISTTYYLIELEEAVVDEGGEDGEEGEESEVATPTYPPLKSVTVTAKAVKYVKGLDGNSFADIAIDTNEVFLVSASGGYYIAEKTEYDDKTNPARPSYTVTTMTDRIIYVVMNESGDAALILLGGNADSGETGGDDSDYTEEGDIEDENEDVAA